MVRLIMTPATGERLVRLVGDRLRFSLRDSDGGPLPAGWRAFLRTNLGSAEVLNNEIIQAQFKKAPSAGMSWQNIPLTLQGSEWAVGLALSEVGFFRAKAYAVEPGGRQHWPEGPDFGVTVHPDNY